MKKSKLSLLFDFLFGVSAVFLVVFVWTRYFLHDFWLTIVLSVIISFCVCSLYYFVGRKKRKKLEISKSEVKKISDISTYFLLSTKTETLKTFLNFLPKEKNPKIKSDMILCEKTALRPLYHSTEITDKDVIESYAKIKNTAFEKLIICCKSASAKAKEIAGLISSKEILILTEVDAYKKIYLPVDFNPPIIEVSPKNKQNNLKNLASVAFNKKRTKDYFIVSVILFFSSFILRYNIYYLIWSTVTCSFALYSYFNKRFNKPETSNSIL